MGLGGQVKHLVGLVLREYAFGFGQGAAYLDAAVDEAVRVQAAERVAVVHECNDLVGGIQCGDAGAAQDARGFGSMRETDGRQKDFSSSKAFIISSSGIS